MNRSIAVAFVVVSLAACGRKPKAETPKAAPSPVEAAAPVNGSTDLPPSSSLKDASSVPLDPIAKVEAQRLAKTVVSPGALSDPAKLAAVCLQARVACGFELQNGVWNRPESLAPRSNLTAAQALAAFAGRDYRLAWIGPVAHVFPAGTEGPLPLDETLSADVSMNSSSRAPAQTIHDVAVKLGLRMPVPRRRGRRSHLIGSSTLPIDNSARFILDYLARPAILHPNSYVAVYAPGKGGSLSWFWGEPPPW